MNKDSCIAVFGHAGLVGSAIMRKLKAEGFTNLVTETKDRLDLRDQASVENFFDERQIEQVIIAAGLVGGIVANNSRRAEFIYDNTMIQFNIIHTAYQYGIKKLLALGSACIYNRENDGTPIKEDQLMTGKLEPTNEPYAISKIAALKMCDAYRDQYGCNFISAMPCNLYGPGDHYDLQKSHVIPALLRKFITAKKNNDNVTLWGTLTPKREFLFVDDLAEACLFLMENYNDAGHVNIGTGSEIQLSVLANLIASMVDFQGLILKDTSKPDGMPRRVLDVAKINSMGWKAKTSLIDGLRLTINDIYATNKHAEW